MLLLDRKLAHWLRLALPNITTPAALNLEARVESRGTFAPYNAKDPAVLLIWSFVAMLFLMRIGMPCKGPLVIPLARSASNSAAMLAASGLISVTQLSVLLTSLILATYAYCLLGTCPLMSEYLTYIDQVNAGELVVLETCLKLL